MLNHDNNDTNNNDNSVMLMIFVSTISMIDNDTGVCKINIRNLYTIDFRNFIVFLGPRPWHIEIRHRVKRNTINLFGFETLKLRIRRLKLWKPTVTS